MSVALAFSPRPRMSSSVNLDGRWRDRHAHLPRIPEKPFGLDAVLGEGRPVSERHVERGDRKDRGAKRGDVADTACRGVVQGLLRIFRRRDERRYIRKHGMKKTNYLALICAAHRARLRRGHVKTFPSCVKEMKVLNLGCRKGMSDDHWCPIEQCRRELWSQAGTHLPLEGVERVTVARYHLACKLWLGRPKARLPGWEDSYGVRRALPLLIP